MVQSGAAYVFARVGTNWTQQAYLKSSAPQVDGLFGDAVSVSGDTVVIGALGEDAGAGAAHVFTRTGTNWTPQARLKASNANARDQFAWSVAVSADTVAVGAPFEDSGATGINGNQFDNGGYESGAGYVFVRSGTNWSQQAYLKASNTGGAPIVEGVGDYFGMAIALSGDTVLAGAFTEASQATGVNGNQGNNSAPGAGAAYAYGGLGNGPRLAVTPGNGGPIIRFRGAAEVSYRLQRAVKPGGSWETIATSIAPASGWIEHHDTTPPDGQAFYQVAQP